MYRRYAEPLAITASVLLLLMAGCGTTPRDREAASMPSVPGDAAPEESATTVPLIDRDASVGKGESSNAAGGQKLTADTTVPPQAAHQFNDAVAMLNSDAAGAENAFRNLATSYPAYAAPLVNLAILQTKAGNLDAAEKSLKDATSRNANSAPAFNQLGIVYRRMGKFREADDAYQRAVSLDENYASAWLNLGVLCDLYLQQPQRALEAYEKYLSLAATPDARVNGWVTELKARLGSGRSARTE